MLVSKYKTILFDFDETLVEAYKIKWKQHKTTAKKFYGVKLTTKTIRKYWGMPFEKMVDLFYEHKDKVENMSKNYHSLDHLFKKYPYKDTIKVLNFLHKNKFILGLVTSMTKSSVIKDMKESGIPYEKFGFFQGSQDTNYHKPDPRVFNKIIKKLRKKNIKKEEILYVEDDIRDMQAAIGAGIGFVAIPNGLTTKREFEKNNIRCIKELSDLIN